MKYPEIDGVPVDEIVKECIGKSRGSHITLVYELWQQGLIDESVYLREIGKEQARENFDRLMKFINQLDKKLGHEL